MKSLFLALTVAMMVVSFVSFAPATANSDTVDAAAGTVFVTGWGRNYDEAEQKAKQKAEQYVPYEIVDTEHGWDPTHIPHNYQYYWTLELKLL